MPHHSRQCRTFTAPQSGVNLLEIMICVSIIAIMLQLALPSTHWRDRDESERLIQHVAELIQLARSYAIRSGQTVTLCPLGGNGCGSDWNQGIALVSGNELVHRQNWNPVHGTLYWRGFGASTQLEFTASGALLHQNGNFLWCPRSLGAVSPHQLVINSAGRIRMADDSNGDGWREDASGEPLTCPAA